MMSATCAQWRNNTMERWTPRMLPTIPKSLWRKSSQWAALNREHALQAVKDTVINNVIKKHCVYGYDSYLKRCAGPFPISSSSSMQTEISVILRV